MNLEKGKQLLKLKEYKQSEVFFLKQLNTTTNPLEIYFYLGLIYFEVNQFKKSIFYLVIIHKILLHLNKYQNIVKHHHYGFQALLLYSP